MLKCQNIFFVIGVPGGQEGVKNQIVTLHEVATSRVNAGEVKTLLKNFVDQSKTLRDCDSWLGFQLEDNVLFCYGKFTCQGFEFRFVLFSGNGDETVVRSIAGCYFSQTGSGKGSCSRWRC